MDYGPSDEYYKHNNILAIDEGNEYSGYCVLDSETYEPLKFGKIDNNELLDMIPNLKETWNVSELAIERIESYGMAVGKSIFDTCVWAGRFIERCHRLGIKYEWVTRKEEKMMICQSMKANDSTIRRALIDMFAKHDFKNGKGTKKNPDFFYGFRADIWSAFAVGYVYIERRKLND